MTIKDFIQSENKKTQKIHEEREKANGPAGMGGTDLSEDVPAFNALSNEKVIKGQNNSWIVLGRDRPGGKDSGGTGKGSTQSGMIDLCVGRLAGMKPTGLAARFLASKKEEQQLADPDFFSDAARVYLTQKGHIDEYFGLVKGSEPGKDAAKDRSAIGIKADHVRIVGKCHIKIVTGRAEATGTGRGGERLSTGGKNETAGRIDLIAGNYTQPKKILSLDWLSGGLREKVETLQPIPKGGNLVDFCTELLEVISDLADFCKFNSNQIVYLNKAVAKHFHPIGAVGPVPVAMPCPPLQAICTVYGGLTKTRSNIKLKACNYNLSSLEMSYLVPGAAAKYINSSHVNTT